MFSGTKCIAGSIRFAALAVAGFTLAACETSGPGPSNVALVPPPLPSPTIARSTTTTPMPVQRTTISERTSVSPDGRTVNTTRTSTTVGFDPNKAAAAGAALISAMNRPTDGSIPGTWTTRSSSTGTGCTVALYGGPGATDGGAAASCNSSSVLNGLSSWRYDQGRLTLMKGAEEALVLNQAGPHRFDGTAKWGFLSTTITLFR